MPFTFSHPALIIPVNKLLGRYLSLAGLVIGAVTPDFEYFLRLKSKYSHTPGGLFWFDLPLGIILTFIFFNIIMPSLTDNLPVILKSRLTGLRKFDWNSYFKENWLKVCLSILIGSATHLLWDSFTHYSGYFVQTFPFLRSNVRISGYIFPVYRVLQHLSTLIGGMAVVFYIWKLPAKEIKPGASPVYWLAVILIATVIISAYFMNASGYDLWNSVIVTMAGLFAALTAAPFALRALSWKKKPDNI